MNSWKFSCNSYNSNFRQYYDFDQYNANTKIYCFKIKDYFYYTHYNLL